MCGCLSSAPYWGPGPQPRHMPWLGINWQPFGLQSGTQSTEPHQPGPNFFPWRLFQHICRFHDGWFTSTPAHTALNIQQFLTKNSMTPMPHSPYSPDLTSSDVFLFHGWKKSSKRNVLPMWKRWNKKMAEALEGMKIDEFKHCLEPWKKYLNRCYCIKWRVLWKWLKFKHVRIHNFFKINSGFFGSPLEYTHIHTHKQSLRELSDSNKRFTFIPWHPSKRDKARDKNEAEAEKYSKK